MISSGSPLNALHFSSIIYSVISFAALHCIIIGASLSEPHTREFGAEISVYNLLVYMYMFVSIRLCARIAGQNVRVSMAEQLLTLSQQVTGSILGNDMFFFSPKIFFLQCTRMRVK